MEQREPQGAFGHAIAKGRLSKDPESPLYAGDFNNDGVINLSDIVRFTGGIGANCN